MLMKPYIVYFVYMNSMWPSIADLGFCVQKPYIADFELFVYVTFVFLNILSKLVSECILRHLPLQIWNVVSMFECKFYVTLHCRF